MAKTDEPQSPAPEPAAPETEPSLFPQSLSETVDAIGYRRNTLRLAEQAVLDAQAERARIQNEIDVLNSLRALHNQPPL